MSTWWNFSQNCVIHVWALWDYALYIWHYINAFPFLLLISPSMHSRTYPHTPRGFPSSPWASILDHYEVSVLRSGVGWTSACLPTITNKQMSYTETFTVRSLISDSILSIIDVHSRMLLDKSCDRHLSEYYCDGISGRKAWRRVQKSHRRCNTVNVFVTVAEYLR